MKTQLGWLGALALLGVFMNSGSGGARGEDSTARIDGHSLGNPWAVRVTHVDLDLAVDFTAKKLRGTATLKFQRAPGSPADGPLWLDTRALAVSRVESEAAGEFQPVRFELEAARPFLGSRLVVHPGAGSSKVRVHYETAPEASALQWLAPALTAGKQHPFLFTQAQAIHARSWIPLQDSPGVRITYDAVIHAPAGLTAVMAAESLVRPDEARQGVFRFTMKTPIPSYLIALAVGDLAFRALSGRAGVWAEPPVVPKAHHEFADTEAMIAAVEKRYGPYRWGRYDLLVLPPSFPFGGMENPRLTFATPTVLAGDRSLVSLVAHELAHSWSGNLVTNATWRDFWLNEGTTTYLERRIIEDIYGRQRAEIEAVLGLAELESELAELPERDQILHIDLSGRDPDEGMTRVPYEKGALLLRTLEEAVGRERFDAFLRRYFDHFAFQSIITADFRAYLIEHLFEGKQPPLDLDAWLERPGLPAGHAIPRSDRLKEIETLARDWSAGKRPIGEIKTSEWSTQEWLRFLHSLPERMEPANLAELDQALGLTDRGNAEIAHAWLLVAIRGGYQPADHRLEEYLMTIGRRKLVLPLYKALAATPMGKARARAIYEKARPGYHPITVQSVDQLLGLSAPER